MLRPLIALPAGGMLVLVGALFGAPDTGKAALIRMNYTHTYYFAQAQAPATEPVLTKRTINLTEEDRHTIREIVLKDSKVAPDTRPLKIAIGDEVPKEITTYEFPELAGNKISALKSHRYFIKDGGVIIVSGGSSGSDARVADIVKAE
jgi:hypothetical protein